MERNNTWLINMYSYSVNDKRNKTLKHERRGAKAGGCERKSKRTRVLTLLCMSNLSTYLAVLCALGPTYIFTELLKIDTKHGTFRFFPPKQQGILLCTGHLALSAFSALHTSKARCGASKSLHPLRASQRGLGLRSDRGPCPFQPVHGARSYEQKPCYILSQRTRSS